MANNDGLVYNDTNNLMYIKADGTDYQIIDVRGGTMSGTLNMGSNVLTGNNFNITGVNQLTINDPGEGILFGGGSNNVTLYAIDDATDNKMNFSGASELQVNGSKVFHDAYHPNADTLTTARTISLTGDVTGSVSFNGSSNVSITATVVDDSHSHTHLNSDGTSEAPDNALQYFQTSSNTSINPSSDWYNTIRMGHGDPVTYYSNTIAVKMTGSNVGDLYTRTIVNGTAQSWNRFWHNNNDGAGSGLDADTLDGVQGSSYLRSDASDTFTGTLTMSGSINFGSSNGNINLSRGGWITFYEDGNANHGIGSRSNSGGEADDIRINSYGAVYINLDSNNNNTSGADFVIGRHGSATGTISELFRVSGETGNVGIGDTNPDAKLTVFRGDTTYAINLSNTEARAGLSVKSSSTFDSKLTISSGASSRQYIQAVNNAATTGRDICINPYGGNVGIGTDSPSQKLHVVGVSGATVGFQIINSYGSPTINAYYGSLTTSNSLYVGTPFSGFNCYAAAFNITSDYRLKENIIELTGAISKIKNLRPVRFNYKNKEETINGFIAHEVQDVVPEAVTGEKDALYEDGKEKYQGLDNGKLIPLLTAALQEAISKIEQLEARIQTLENK